MKLTRNLLLAALGSAGALTLCAQATMAQVSIPGTAGASRMTAYAFSFPGLQGGTINLADYAGKPVLVVNTASFCGYTNQFGGLAKLYETYRAKGLVIIGVPSNDFGAQEPGGPKEIAETAGEYKVAFPMTGKTVVKGPGAHRFYKWAAEQRPGETPSWNFHKYLIGRDGRIAAVFSTQTRPDDAMIISAIEQELGN